MLRDRLKEMDLRITELADYLQISRPTMYKFIEYYDESQFNLINKKALKLFNYITENELAGKKNVINYILNNLVDVNELGDNKDLIIIKRIKNLIISNPDSKKTQFLELCSSNTVYDKIICYLMDIYPLLKKKNLQDYEEKLLNPYLVLVDTVNKTILHDKGEE